MYNVHVHCTCSLAVCFVTIKSKSTKVSTAHTYVYVYLFTCCVHLSLGDSGEDSFFDIGGEVIDEMAPQPHLLVAEGTTALIVTSGSSATNANHNKETKTFPQLKSHLLQVCSVHCTCHMYMYMYMYNVYYM